MEEPLEEYQKQVNARVFSAEPYDRLMIHYRKQKQYEKELGVIKKGIDTFQKFYEKLHGKVLKRKMNPAVKALSKKISKITGLMDKKGNEVFLPEPLPRWIKRQSVVEQKIKKTKKANIKKK